MISPNMAYKPSIKPSPQDDILSMSSNAILALDHVLDNILGIPTSSIVQFAFSAFWIYTINDYNIAGIPTKLPCCADL
jgi:hypothetical protein